MSRDWAVGDEVLGWAPACMAELVVAQATSVAPKPAGLDWAVAGGIGLVGNTARRASASLSLNEHDTVLVSGVAGGVGLLSAQFALRAGAKVIGTASNGAPRLPARPRHRPGHLRRWPGQTG